MALEDRLWRVAREELAAGRRLVLCTIIAASGSTPREVGARMILGERGLLAGTVGGGCAEADVLATARRLLAEREAARCIDIDLAGDLLQHERQACGGSMRVLVESFESAERALVSALAEAEERRTPRMIVTRLPFGAESATRAHLDPELPLPPEFPAELAAARESERPFLLRCPDGEWFAQIIGNREELVIVGSGHVAQPLAEFAARLGYRVALIDDRSAFANRERFPDVSDILVGDHAALLRDYALGPRSSVVIVTRGHRYDEAALRAALNRGARYIGMIGSRRRALATLEHLKGAGYPPEALERVHSPIGLDIGALTPEEVALAIIAEIVCARHGGSGVPLRERRGKGQTGKSAKTTRE